MKLVTITLIALAFILPFASAATQLNIYVDDVGDALFLGQTDQNISFPSGIIVQNGRISGYTSNLTVKEGTLWTFSYVLNGSELTVILPEGAVIKSLSGGEISLEGTQISLYVHDRINISYIIDKQTQEDSTWVFFVIIGLLLVVVVAVYVLNFKHREPRVRKVKKKAYKLAIVHSILNERENLILEKLKTLGKSKSSYLRKACDIPKASFSRHIRELEKKGLVKLSGDGKNKIVELKK